MNTSSCNFRFLSSEWNRRHQKKIPKDVDWKCPHPRHETRDYCIFHITPTNRQKLGITTDDVREGIRELLLSERKNQIYGAAFEKLDLEYFASPESDTEPIDLLGTTITDELRLNHSRLQNPLLLHASILNDIYAEFARIPILGLQNTVVRNRINLFSSDIDFILATNSSLSNLQLREAESSKLIFSGADIDGASFNHAKIGGCRFEGANFLSGTEFNDCIFENVANFRDANFFGSTEFNGATFSRDAYFSGSSYTRPVDFGNAVFEGELGIQKAEFEEKAIFNDVSCDGTVYAGESIFNEGVDWSGTSINGSLNILKSTINGRANFRSMSVSNKLQVSEANPYWIDIRNSEIDEFSLYFSDTNKIQAHSAIVNEFQCSKANIEKMTFFQSNIETAGFLEVEFKKFEARSCEFGKLFFSQMSISPDTPAFGHRSYFDLSGTTIQSGHLTQPEIGHVLYDISKGTVGDIRISQAWPNPFYYIGLRRTQFDNFDFKQYSDSLSNINNLHHTLSIGRWRSVVRINELEITYRQTRIGAKQVNAVDFRERLYKAEKRYRRERLKAMAATKTGFEKLEMNIKAAENWILDKITGYGEDPIRPVIISIGTIAAFCPVYVLFSDGVDGLGAKVEFSVATSIQSFTTLFFGDGNQLQSPIVRILAAVEGFTGALLIALLVFTLTKTME
ncbi:pentapeptide repeat-containing protein [Halococcus thailandensis]|uniref:pentapeptide repeat-containing protein n=1 Tax=Halococcus thailandensis TaxID=335952 RepID=UPI0009B5B6CE|nr:pentapeptide repeat-containing protein [Halococcus thailandensis]